MSYLRKWKRFRRKNTSDPWCHLVPSDSRIRLHLSLLPLPWSLQCLWKPIGAPTPIFKGAALGWGRRVCLPSRLLSWWRNAGISWFCNALVASDSPTTSTKPGCQRQTSQKHPLLSPLPSYLRAPAREKCHPSIMHLQLALYISQIPRAEAVFPVQWK